MLVIHPETKETVEAEYIEAMGVWELPDGRLLNEHAVELPDAYDNPEPTSNLGGGQRSALAMVFVILVAFSAGVVFEKVTNIAVKAAR